MLQPVGAAAAGAAAKATNDAASVADAAANPSVRFNCRVANVLIPPRELNFVVTPFPVETSYHAAG
ncbi:hypothetical protein [Plantactinospora sp. GCM10030261]|uniref:hypothetical protein n=1 Tax=Plantactinospora sp. GCM10030261 TaxID=3273420 RepID=UPI003618CB3D